VNQPEAQPEHTAGWSPRTLRLALLASLAVNLLGIGLIVGTILSGPQHLTRGGEFGLKSFSFTLPEERGKMMRSDFQTHKPAVTELRKSARAARNEAIEVLAAEPYDQAKLSAALARLNEAETQGRQRISEFFLATAGKMTPEERVALSNWWRKRQAERDHRRRGHHEEKPDAAAVPAQ
jgi:uncharacterized membrane protein